MPSPSPPDSHSSYEPGSPPSGSITTRSTGSPSVPPNCPAIAGDSSRIRAFECARMSRYSAAASRVFNATTAAPPPGIPKCAASNHRVFGLNTATRSPTATPLPRTAAAIRSHSAASVP
jgi:hypothetical protein